MDELSGERGWRITGRQHRADLLQEACGRSGLTYGRFEALCFGWIDGILKRIDDEKHMIRFTPRRKNSIWSEHNKKRVRRLIKEGRMTDAGLAKIREAKANGQWDKAAQREDITVVPGLTERGETKGPAEFRAPRASYHKQFIYGSPSPNRMDPAQKGRRNYRIAEPYGSLG
jgi:hypothetical protein